jgi:hypothetical protein
MQKVNKNEFYNNIKHLNIKLTVLTNYDVLFKLEGKTIGKSTHKNTYFLKTNYLKPILKPF